QRPRTSRVPWRTCQRGNRHFPRYPRNPVSPVTTPISSGALTEVVTSAFDDRIETRQAKLGIIGLGYAGLPLAMSFAEAGYDITGVDLNEERVQAVGERRSYLVDVPADRYAQLDGDLVATTDYGAVAELDAVTICVPTPLSKTRTPDLSFIVSAAESVAANLRPGQLVVLQSTTHPGTTEELVLPIL